ncbi:8-amino-7-oxononanoate synthase [Psychromonas arctica]|uniref:8-amino-7-oxononanoate synthase n=1 Tax=Psychromonas arctica TaxID=168275 RepID=UPI002FD00641
MSFSFIAEQLKQQKAQHLHRRSVQVTGKQGRFIEVDGNSFVNFSSNDYLGLASEPALINAWKRGGDLFGIGSGGSYLVTGYNQVHHDVTEQLKSWLNVDAIALFNSGYSANQAIIKLLLRKDDLLVQDKLNHASLMEAGIYSQAKMQRFKHNDMAHLGNILKQHIQTDNKLIISEGVFSMDGDIAPMTELCSLAKQNNAWLMIDDAHGIGVLGENGQGSVAQANQSQQDIDIYMATFGKALGVGGALIAGSTELIDYINNFSKPYVYSTGLPPAMVYCIGEAAKLAEQQQWRRDHLAGLINYFKHLSGQYDIPLMPSNSAIQPILMGSSKQALDISVWLKKQGIWTTAIRPPTVPNNTARLRVTLTTNHHKSDILLLVTKLKQAIDANSH